MTRLRELFFTVLCIFGAFFMTLFLYNVWIGFMEGPLP